MTGQPQHSINPAPDKPAPAPARHYRIRVEGQLGPGWSEWFAGMTLSQTESGDSLLSGPVVDQAALHGLLARIRDLNLTLIAVERIEPGQRGRRE
jgi:hypothetical protein